VLTAARMGRKYVLLEAIQTLLLLENTALKLDYVYSDYCLVHEFSVDTQINNWSDFIYPSDTGEKVGVKWYSKSAIYIPISRKLMIQLRRKYHTIF
jgi:hypothetical protein